MEDKILVKIVENREDARWNEDLMHTCTNNLRLLFVLRDHTIFRVL